MDYSGPGWCTWGLFGVCLKIISSFLEISWNSSVFPMKVGHLRSVGRYVGALRTLVLSIASSMASLFWTLGHAFFLSGDSQDEQLGKVQFAYIISVMVVCSSNIHFSRRLHVTRLFSKTLLENDFRHLWTLLRLKSGWWFGTFFIFPYIGNHHPNWLSYFQRGWNHNWPFRTQCFCVGGKLEAP